MVLIDILNHSEDIFIVILDYLAYCRDVRSLTRLKCTCARLATFLAAKDSQNYHLGAFLAHYRGYSASLEKFRTINRFQIIKRDPFPTRVTFLEFNGNLTIYTFHNRYPTSHNGYIYGEIYSSRIPIKNKLEIIERFTKVCIRIHRMNHRYELEVYNGDLFLCDVPKWLTQYMLRGPKKIIARIDTSTFEFDVDEYC
jgi:hypothetical protein